jgi:hypothetical protein
MVRKAFTIFFVLAVFVWLSTLTFLVLTSDSRRSEPGAWFLASGTEIRSGPYKSDHVCHKAFAEELVNREDMAKRLNLTQAQQEKLERAMPLPVCRYFFNNGVAK